MPIASTAAAGALYRFVWNGFCDWYLELTKPILTGEDGPAKEEVRTTCAYVTDEILKLLHPFMPFITEELWRAPAKRPAREGMLVLTQSGGSKASPRLRRESTPPTRSTG